MNSSTDDRKEIEACIQKYFDGIAQHNSTLVAEPFHSQAIMSMHRGDDFMIVPAAETMVEYMKSIPPIQETSPDFGGRILSIETERYYGYSNRCRGQTGGAQLHDLFPST